MPRADGQGVGGTMMTGGHDGQTAVTVKGVETPVTPVAIVEVGHCGHVFVIHSVVLDAGRPGATAGHEGQGTCTVIVVAWPSVDPVGAVPVEAIAELPPEAPPGKIPAPGLGSKVGKEQVLRGQYDDATVTVVLLPAG